MTDVTNLIVGCGLSGLVVAERLANAYQTAYTTPFIIHYASDKKPWFCPELPLAAVWWRYARQTPHYENLLRKIEENQSIWLLSKRSLWHLFKLNWQYVWVRVLSSVTWGSRKTRYVNKKKEVVV